MKATPTLDSAKPHGPIYARWLRRFGVAGFLFFFIKGLLWLIVPVLIAYFGCD